MSVYVQALMPFDFDRLSDKVAAIETITNIKNQLAEHFHLKQGFELEIEDYENTEWPDSPNEYRVDTPFHDFDIIIGNGSGQPHQNREIFRDSFRLEQVCGTIIW